MHQPGAGSAAVRSLVAMSVHLLTRVARAEPTASPAGSAPMLRVALIRRWRCAALAPLLTACAAGETTSMDRFAETGELIAMSGAGAGAANACFTCHGLDGRGDGEGSPRLATIDAGYLERQLIAFADGRRDHAQMAWIAARLDPEERKAVAAYYAAMRFDGAPGQPSTGEAILYRNGDPGRGIPACATCHGTNGEGIGPANPPLAGQSAAYLVGQLDQWRRSKRRNDPGGVMLAISQLLSPREQVGLSRHAAGLSGALPRPEPAEALRSAHRAATRSDGPAQPLHVPEAARATE